MSGVPDRDRVAAKPFLITREADGSYRLTLRETRYNSQNYPVVAETRVEESFKSTAAARAFARERYGAVAGEFALK